MTNFDKLKQSPESLVDMLMEDCDTGCCELCCLNSNGMCTEESDCRAGMLTWLYQEAV